MKRGEPKRRFHLPILTLLLASGTVASAQLVLETRPGEVRVWDSSARSVEVSLDPGRVPRSAVAAEGGHVVAGESRVDSDLFFTLAAAAGEAADLPVPPRSREVLRARPVLLAQNDRLDGAVWLEGDSVDGLAVVAAAWNGTSWEAGETVAPANGRPQLAPAAAVLADGSWLAVWAGFDGKDDEIFWSRRVDGIWSPARRLHRDNGVPDLLPALTADGEGALAAWSTYDEGDYRLQTARFDGRGWRVDEARIDGLGVVDARWQKSGERSFVTFRTVVPEGWSAVELGREGEVAHRVTVETTSLRPPVIEAGSPWDPPRLIWPSGATRPRR